MSSLRETILLKPGSQPPSPTPRVPTALQRTAVGRLSIFAGVMAGLIWFVLVLNHLLVRFAGFEPEPGFEKTRLVKLGLALLSLVVGATARWGGLRPATMLHVGLIYEVVGAFLVALSCGFQGVLVHDHMATITWVSIWIVAFPLVVPARPGTNVVASFAAASTPPLAAWLLGEPLPSAQRIVASFLPNYMSAVMAIVPALLIYRLNCSLHSAEKKLEDLGAYQLVELLGKGGMGEVWRAEHRMLARPAAIKLVHLADEEETIEGQRNLLRRFEVEARATASLHSPHTVSLYDFGTTREGTFYYVMELLTGLDLESLVSRFGPVSPARAVFILKQVCASLAEAHASGMVHRDIKPANLYLCRLGLEHDWVKVLDFGLVGRAKGCTSCGKGENKERLTAVNTIVGTPSFMSPEMAEGMAEIDGRADIYAVGCVAYWLLTGKLLFEGHDKTPMKILMDHVGTKPEPPSRRLGKPIPPSLEAVVMKCLEKNPNDRPATASELARLLDACELEGVWSATHAREWWHEHLTDLAAIDPDPAHSSTVIRPFAAA